MEMISTPEKDEVIQELIEKIMAKLKSYGRFYLSIIFCEAKNKHNIEYMDIRMVSHLPPEIKNKVLQALLQENK